MPFKSEKQRRFLHAKHPDIAARWEKEHVAKQGTEKRNRKVTVRGGVGKIGMVGKSSPSRRHPGITYKGGTAREMKNTECGKQIGSGKYGGVSHCTRLKGHDGKHTAYHPSVKQDVEMRRQMAARARKK